MIEIKHIKCGQKKEVKQLKLSELITFICSACEFINKEKNINKNKIKNEIVLLKNILLSDN